MKKSGKLLSAFGMIAALVIGFLIGISVNFPKVDNSKIIGTIGKIENYRKVQGAITEIELQNELTSDSAKLKSLQNYLNFYYLMAVKMADDIQFTIEESNATEAFKTANQVQITNLANYEKFLSSARIDLLLAISVCKAPEKTDPLLLKDLLNQANNVIAQINFKNKTVLNYIDLLASYIDVNNTGNTQGLMRANDLLALNELNSAIITRDKLLLKSLDKKPLFGDAKNMKWIDQQNMNKLMQQDIEKLGAFDIEKLGIFDIEKLGLDNTETLRIFCDSEKLGIFCDSEKLGIVNDSEKLGIVGDTEKLGIVGDTEKLSIVGDTEKLGIVGDTEKLGIFDTEVLGIVF